MGFRHDFSEERMNWGKQHIVMVTWVAMGHHFGGGLQKHELMDLKRNFYQGNVWECYRNGNVGHKEVMGQP